MRSKADISQLNLPHETKNEKVENTKNIKQKTDVLRCIGKQSGESVESVLEKKMEATVGRFAEKEGFKPGKSERVMGEDSGESTEPTEEVPLAFI